MADNIRSYLACFSPTFLSLQFRPNSGHIIYLYRLYLPISGSDLVSDSGWKSISLDSFLCSALWKTTQTELINGNVYVLYVFAALLYGLNSNSWWKHGILAILRWSIAIYLQLDSLGLDSTISSNQNSECNVSQSQR